MINQIGTVFDIKEFSIYDGPGVRVTVFLKGCPLRCKWCHNPEGLTAKPQVMLSANSCTDCGMCKVDDCDVSGGRAHIIGANEACSGCGKCVALCPAGLRKLAGTRYTVAELRDKLMKYSVFISDGGGVTFSGGEPTMQHEFLCSVLDELPFHKAIQTCGYCDEAVFEKVLERLDFLFFDIKHTDSSAHKLYTGVDNAKILRNLEILKASEKPFVARIPLISGVNDGAENLENTARLLKGARFLQRVELLPYNAAAGAKYEMTGRAFSEPFAAPDKIDVSPFTQLGIEAKVM